VSFEARFRGFQFQTDCPKIVKLWSFPNSLIEFELVVKDYGCLRCPFDIFSLNHVRREPNKVAHALAKISHRA